MSTFRRTIAIRIAAVTAIAVALLALLAPRPATSVAASPDIGALHSALGRQQARQQSLTAGIGSLTGLISSLDAQISLVQSREAVVAGALAADRAELARVQRSLARERIRLIRLRHRLAISRTRLAGQLISSYESNPPDLVSVVLSAHGFNDLLDQVAFLGRAEHQQQSIIAATRSAKAQADQAARQLATLQQSDRQVTVGAQLRVRALAGMNLLLASKQAALQSARVAQQDALAASQAQGQDLQRQITRAEAQQAAARRAAAAAAAAAAQRAAVAAAQRAATPVTAPAAVGPSGGWAIPYAIVLCESGGQNLPPNSAGASGYYQIIPGTWKLFGGSGPAAYLTGKAEQDAVATRIWNGGAGASNWVCAGIVGIH